MDIKVCEDYNEMSLQIAEFIANYVKEKPEAVLCFPAGDTPLGAFKHLAEFQDQERVDFSKCTFIGLDEWVGLSRDDEGSCKGFMYDQLFTPLSIQEPSIFFFDACAADLDKQCDHMNDIIARKGGIDLMFVGLGINGHIGLNEPGVDLNSYSHVVELDPVTQTVAQKYFSKSVKLEKGITIGMGHVMEAKTMVLAVSGDKKSAIVEKVLTGEVTNEIPGSSLQRHNNCYVFLDRVAAAGLAL